MFENSKLYLIIKVHWIINYSDTITAFRLPSKYQHLHLLLLHVIVSGLNAFKSLFARNRQSTFIDFSR